MLKKIYDELFVKSPFGILALMYLFMGWMEGSFFIQ